MLRTSIPALFAAASLALGGCTIYTSSSPPPRPAARPAVVARPAPPRNVPIMVQRNQGTTLPTTTGPVTTVPLLVRAPRITSPILFGNGTGGAFRGEAFVIAENVKRLPDLGPLVPFATLFTDSFEVKPQVFTGGFPGALKQDDWFAIRYQGSFLVEAAGTVEFHLTSDDGAILSVDGQKLADNDGVHGVTSVTAQRELAAGPHLLRLDYFQGAKGQVALILDVVERGPASKSESLHPLHGITP